MENLATDYGEQSLANKWSKLCQTQQLQSAADQAKNHRARKRIRKKLHRRARQESNFRLATAF